MPANRNMRGNVITVSKEIEDAIRSAIRVYEKQHGLEWCEGCFDPKEIKEAAELLLSAGDSEVCICLDYALGYRSAVGEEDYFLDCDHRTSRIHLRGNSAAFTVVLQKKGSCVDHRNVLIPRSDLLSKGKEALLEGAETGNATAMFALSRLFDQGIGEPQDPEEAYFWHCVAMAFYEDGGDGEWIVDAAADNRGLAAKLPSSLAGGTSPLRTRVKEWIRAHSVFLPDSDSQYDEQFDYDLDDNEDDQDEAEES